MSKVFLVIEKDDGIDDAIDVFAELAEAEAFAEELRVANRYTDVCVVKKDVE